MFLTKDNKIKWKFLSIAFILVLLLCGIGVFWLDQPLFIFMRRFDFAGWQFFDTFFSAKSWIIIFGLIFAAALAINKVIKNRGDNSVLSRISYHVSRITFHVLSSVVLASLATWVLKFGIGRMRPVFFESLGISGFFPFMNEWAFNSMPSGHAAASFAGLVMIGLLFPKIKWVSWTIAIIAGISRIAIGDHWPSDVLLGAFIGMAAADFVKAMLSKKLK